MSEQAQIESVAVVGAGAMGAGIAQVSALAGYPVILYDLDAVHLERAVTRINKSILKGVERGKTTPDRAVTAKSAIRTTDLLANVYDADLIIEAVPEIIELKRELFSEIDAGAKSDAILASNTSSLSISAIAAATRHPQRVIGLHFFNPVYIMKLVEVIRGDLTAHGIVERSLAFVDRLEKTAVLCDDTPGFIVNRIARPFYGEALRLLGEKIADAQTIDDLIRRQGFRMGPFELIDLVGADVNLDVTQAMFDATFQEPRFRPHPIQKRMVESGRLGRKTKRGFYDYRDD